MTEGGGLELKAEQRGGDAEPNLLPHGASTFHPFVFSPLFSTSFASHSPSPRWSSGPLVWRRYKANARARLPSVWCRFLPKLPQYYFPGFMLFEQTRAKTSTVLIFQCCAGQESSETIKEGERVCTGPMFTVRGAFCPFVYLIHTIY